MDVPDLAVLEQRGRDEQPMIGRFLDERDDDRQILGRGRQIGQARIVQAERHLGRQILELVAGQAELREDDQVGALGPRRSDELVVPGQVGREAAEHRSDLSERHTDRVHGRSIREDA